MSQERRINDWFEQRIGGPPPARFRAGVMQQVRRTMPGRRLRMVAAIHRLLAAPPARLAVCALAGVIAVLRVCAWFSVLLPGGS